MFPQAQQPELQPSLLFSEQELAWMREHQGETNYDAWLLSGKISPTVFHQIKSKAKVKYKIPHFASHEQVVFPPSVNLEQSSSEQTAKFKATLLAGTSFLDITCGFGVDSFYLSDKFEQSLAIEQNVELANIVSHNYAILGKQHIQFIAGINSIDYLQQHTEQFDWIYADPARRDMKGSKVVRFADCEPNVVQHQALLLQHANRILIKSSPFHDIQAALAELQFVKDVYIVAVDNECKELFFVIEKNLNSEATIHAINLTKHQTEQLAFKYSEEKETSLACQTPMEYVFEPNASILKAGAFKIMCTKHQVAKLHRNSHLYTANHDVEDFPGRRFQLQAMCKVDKKEVRKHLPEGICNLSIRNFPSSTAELKKKLGIQDGGELFVFATTLYDESKVLLILKKIN